MAPTIKQKVSTIRAGLPDDQDPGTGRCCVTYSGMRGGVMSLPVAGRMAAMVPAVWLEHTTYRLQGGCSTAELSRHLSREITRPSPGCNALSAIIAGWRAPRPVPALRASP